VEAVIVQPCRDDWPESTLLGRLPEPTRAKLLALGKVRAFRNQDYILRQGDQGEHAVLLLDSAVKVFMHTREQREVLLAIRASGDLVGELSVLDHGPRLASVVACGDIRVRIILRAQLDAFLKSEPDAAYEISRMLGGRLRSADEHRADFIGLPSLARFARVLVEVATTYGTESDAGHWDLGISLTKPEVGSLAGMKTRTAESQVEKLVKDGLVKTSYRGITLLDMARLRRVARLA
jgi:CRP-like cAMP-binding protein